MAAVIVEDGTGLVNATSLVSESDLTAYASARGVDLAGENLSILLVKAMDYLILRESELQGTRSEKDQALPFPRTGLTILCQAQTGSVIPVQAKQAQMQTALEVFAKKDVSPSVMSAPVEREKVDIIERKFMTPRQMSNRPDGSIFTPIMPKVEALLYPLLRGNECPGGAGQLLKLVRA